MGVNFFSGTSNRGKTKSTNTAAASDRAKQAKAALSAPAEASASGGTAVGSSGTLSKVGNVVGKVAGIASKFLPGIGGTIAKGISNIFNDPEWWQQVPGDAITLNETLRFSEAGEIVFDDDTDPTPVPAYYHRPAIGEFVTLGAQQTTSVEITKVLPFTVTEQQVTQYLMPQVRKVVNAIPLQGSPAYRKALESGAALYAEWRNLKKYDYMCKHGQTYLANMNDNAFPLFQTKNAAWLQSMINRLEEYLRANVRLPHTLCEYLAWRYGRVYKSNNSAKAALILYDVLPIAADPTVHDAWVEARMNDIAGDTDVQKANTDLFNTYYDHDYMVEVRDDTQFKFDSKEFMLRLNLTAPYNATSQGLRLHRGNELVAIDSNLDNPTAFMASTVSTLGTTPGGEAECLFPVDRDVSVYAPLETSFTVRSLRIGGVSTTPAASTTSVALYRQASNYTINGSGAYAVGDASPLWVRGLIEMDTNYAKGSASETMLAALAALTLSKAIDLYNCGIWVGLFNAESLSPAQAAPITMVVDLSALSIDAGSPTQTVLATEHIYAFANLVDIERKHSMSYKQAEKLVARDTANLIESLDVASVAPTSPVK